MPRPALRIEPLPYADALAARPLGEIDLVVIHCTELPDLAMARDYGERVLPVFRVHAEGRLMRAKLQPQPDGTGGEHQGEDRRSLHRALLRRWHAVTNPQRRARHRSTGTPSHTSSARQAA